MQCSQKPSDGCCKDKLGDQDGSWHTRAEATTPVQVGDDGAGLGCMSRFLLSTHCVLGPILGGHWGHVGD